MMDACDSSVWWRRERRVRSCRRLGPSVDHTSGLAQSFVP